MLSIHCYRLSLYIACLTSRHLDVAYYQFLAAIYSSLLPPFWPEWVQCGKCADCNSASMLCIGLGYLYRCTYISTTIICYSVLRRYLLKLNRSPCSQRILMHKLTLENLPDTIESLQSVSNQHLFRKFVLEVSFDRKQFDIQHARNKSCFDPERKQSLSRIRIALIPGPAKHWLHRIAHKSTKHDSIAGGNKIQEIK